MLYAPPDRPARPRARPRARRRGRRPGPGPRPDQGGRDRSRRRAADDARRHDRRLDDEHPARAHLRPAPRPRRADAQAEAEARDGRADRQRRRVGVHAPPGRAVAQRRALQRRVGEGDDGIPPEPGEQEPLRRVLEAREGGPDRQRLHGALRDREAVAEPHRPRLAHRLPRPPRQGAPRARPGEARREAHRHRAFQVRRVEARRAARPREEPRLLAGTGGREPRAVALLREAGHDPAKLQLTLDTPSGRYPLDKDVSLAIAAQLQRLGITVNVVVNEWGTHLDKIKNRNTGDTFFLGWGPSLFGQGVIEPLFQASQTYSSYGNNPTIDAKIARAVTLVDPKARAAAYAELQKLAHDEAAWVPLWQQHDLYGVAGHVEWAPRADEKVWMYDAKVAP